MISFRFRNNYVSKHLDIRRIDFLVGVYYTGIKDPPEAIRLCRKCQEGK